MYTTDGSVLRGRIVEDVSGEYLTIEIYGGSAFVVAYANVERVRKERNPDYGMAWITVRPGATVTEKPQENHRMTGHIAGAHLGAAYVGFSGNGLRSFQGDVNGDDGENALHAIGGVNYTFLKSLGDVSTPGISWGVRGGLGYSQKRYATTIDDPFNPGQRVDFGFEAYTLDFPTDLLLGVGNRWIMVYVGAGTGLSIYLGERSDSLAEDIGHPSGQGVDNYVLPILRASAGTYLRLGEKWTGEIRGFFESSQTDGWYDGFRQTFHTFGVTAGVGRHFR
ncbi:MAG: hypothetical protein ACLFSV_05725 [Alkalispirochaeta sp.]